MPKKTSGFGAEPQGSIPFHPDHVIFSAFILQPIAAPLAEVN